MAQPCLPGDAWERATQLKKHSMKLPSATNSTSSIAVGASNDPWKHICSQVEGQLPKPDIPGLKPLLNLPRVRDLVTTHTLETDLLPKQIASLIIQVTGEESPRPCSECRRHKGPFTTCVRSTAEVGHLTAEFLGTSCRACANCLYRKNSSACSLRGLSSLGYPPPPSKLAMESKFPWMSDAADATGEDLLGRRRSARLSVTNTHEDGDEGDGESLAGALADSRPRKIVTLKTRGLARAGSGSGTSGYSSRTRRFAAGTGSNIPAETDLHMEDWEADDGRVTPIGNGNSGRAYPRLTTAFVISLLTCRSSARVLLVLSRCESIRASV